MNEVGRVDLGGSLFCRDMTVIYPFNRVASALNISYLSFMLFLD